MKEQFLRSRMLLGNGSAEKLWNSHVAVFGLGGVGSWCAEALARSGIGHLTLIDMDTVSETNINRQILALHSTLNKSKTEVMQERIRDISPDCTVRTIQKQYSAEARAEFFNAGIHYDYIADAIDLVSCKLDLIETAFKNSIPIISAMGTGNKLDASLLEITDIAKTKNCALARVMRKELRKRGYEHLKVVYSPEEPADCEQSDEPLPPGRRSIPGSVIWVPATAGLLMAQEIITQIIEKK